MTINPPKTTIETIIANLIDYRYSLFPAFLVFPLVNSLHSKSMEYIRRLCQDEEIYIQDRKSKHEIIDIYIFSMKEKMIKCLDSFMQLPIEVCNIIFEYIYDYFAHSDRQYMIEIMKEAMLNIISSAPYLRHYFYHKRKEVQFKTHYENTIRTYIVDKTYGQYDYVVTTCTNHENLIDIASNNMMRNNTKNTNNKYDIINNSTNTKNRNNKYDNNTKNNSEEQNAKEARMRANIEKNNNIITIKTPNIKLQTIILNSIANYPLMTRCQCLEHLVGIASIVNSTRLYLRQMHTNKNYEYVLLYCLLLGYIAMDEFTMLVHLKHKKFKVFIDKYTKLYQFIIREMSKNNTY